LVHDSFTDIANGAITKQRNGQHSDTHMMKDCGTGGVGVHKGSQSEDHSYDYEVIGRVVYFALYQYTKDHGKYNSAAFH
jgi:hypothetical protein